MKSELRVRLRELSIKMRDEYDWNNLTRNEQFYKLVVKHEAKDFFISDDDIDGNWVFFKNIHKMYVTMLHPSDIRNFNGDYDF